jgi:hypothetical protein
MSRRLALALALTITVSAVSAAPAQFVAIDQSSETLISKAQAEAVWKGLLPTERLAKLYKPSQWGFASAVEGGFTPNGTCVVTARAMMLPIWRGKMQYPPSRKSTTFDAKPNLSQAQCTELATARLKEAIESMLSGLIKE